MIAILLSSLALAATTEARFPLPPAPAARAFDDVERLVGEGRRHLAAGRLERAEEAIRAALEASGNAPAVRVWDIRLSIARGLHDDALLATDELQAAGAPAGDLAYLRGLAFFLNAKAKIGRGAAGQFTQDEIEEGQRLLARALEADAERYADAWPVLAEAAWYAQDLDAAWEAAARASERAPKDAAVHALKGRIAFSRYTAAVQAEEEARAGELWEDARKSFERAIALWKDPADAAEKSALCDAHLQLANLHAWREDLDAAAKAYTAAMAWDPARVDFAQLFSALGAARFAECTAGAVALFRRVQEESDPRFATLSWWHGYALLGQEDWKASEAAFREAVELWPDYASAWYWIYRASYAQGEFAGALDSLARHAEADEEGLVASLAGEGQAELERLAWLTGWCSDPEKHAGGARNAEAALLSRLLARVEPENPWHWNNLGLFLRDHGDALRRRGEPEPEVLDDLWQRAHAAYAQALALEPDNPNYLNDTAVMLHYYLRSDLDQARRMYEEAERSAAALLDGDALPDEEREVVRIALRDARDNVRRLDAWLERRAAGEDVDPNDVR